MHPIRRLLFLLLRLYWRIAKPNVLGARALVFKDGQILLVKMSYTEGWFLPGGGVDARESFRAAIVRELREECGIEAKNPHLFGLYLSTREGKTDHVAIYIVTDFSEIPGAKPDAEIREMRFFPIRDLPEDATPATRKRVHEYLHGTGGTDTW